MRRRHDMTFAPEEYERRVGELRERMAQRELDAVIITDPENLMYLTDHQTTGYSFFQAHPPLGGAGDDHPCPQGSTSSPRLEHSAYRSGDAILDSSPPCRDLRLDDSAWAGATTASAYQRTSTALREAVAASAHQEVRKSGGDR